MYEQVTIYTAKAGDDASLAEELLRETDGLLVSVYGAVYLTYSVMRFLDGRLFCCIAKLMNARPPQHHCVNYI